MGDLRPAPLKSARVVQQPRLFLPLTHQTPLYQAAPTVSRSVEHWKTPSKTSNSSSKSAVCRGSWLGSRKMLSEFCRKRLDEAQEVQDPSTTSSNQLLVRRPVMTTEVCSDSFRNLGLKSSQPPGSKQSITKVELLMPGSLICEWNTRRLLAYIKPAEHRDGKQTTNRVISIRILLFTSICKILEILEWHCMLR